MVWNKGNNKTTEPRTIPQRECPNSQLHKQTKSVNNRKHVKTAMTPTRHRHLQRNGGLNQIPGRQASRSHYGSKAPAVTATAPKHRNKTGKTVVKAAPHPVTQMSKISLRHTLTKKLLTLLTSLSLHIFTIWKCIAYNFFCRDGIYFDKILVSEYKLFKRSNKANLFIALVQ